MLSFERRRLKIRSMKEEDVEFYYNHFNLSEEEKKQRVKETKKMVRKSIDSTPDKMLILIATELENDNKLIGTILTKNIGTSRISMHITIPNESKEWAYGNDLIDQFIKICKEEPFFQSIRYVKLDKENPTIRRYMQERKISSVYVPV